MIHVHLVGGPHDGETFEMPLEDDDLLPDLLILPTSEDEGELYELAEEDYSCGSPKYLYANYDWEPVGYYDDWDEDEE